MANWRDNLTSYPDTPTKREGYMFKPETCIYVGKGALFAGLETASQSYLTNSAPIGVDHDNGYKLGQVAAVGFTSSPSWDAVESANMAAGSTYDLTGDEATISVTIYELTPEVVTDMFSNGRVFYGPDPEFDEQVIEFGWNCNMRNRPISLEMTNKACQSPSSEALGSGDAAGIYALDSGGGVTGMVITLYDAFNQGGVDFGTLARNELLQAATEWAAMPVYETFNSGSNRGKFGTLVMY